MANDAKQKKSHVLIDLADGTKLECEGPMAEEMARRVLNPHSWPTHAYYYPHYWNPWLPMWTYTSTTLGSTPVSTLQHNNAGNGIYGYSQTNLLAGRQ